MAHPLTNRVLRERLLVLGFRQGGVTEKNNRVYRHPHSDCLLLLPENRSDEPPRPADLVGIQADLADFGHVRKDAFEHFMLLGKLPADADGTT